MAKDYEQMEIDTTLESDRSLKDNVQTIIKFALGQLMEYEHPEQVRNRHEGYGIAAEGYSALGQKVKNANGDMQTMLKLLPNGEGDILNVVGSLYNSAAEIAVEAIKLAAQSQRILNDLYYGESKTPMEEYLEEQETEADQTQDDGFEETENVESEEE
jgi:hypothetical protein